MKRFEILKEVEGGILMAGFAFSWLNLLPPPGTQWGRIQKVGRKEAQEIAKKELQVTHRFRTNSTRTILSCWVLKKLIVVSGLGEEDAGVGYPINHTMFLGDPARPNTTPEMFQQFWLTKTGARITTHCLDQIKHFQSCFPIIGDPVGEIFEKIAIEYEFLLRAAHFMEKRERNCSGVNASPSPDSSLSSADNNRLAFAGERNKCAVSIRPSHSSFGSRTTDSDPLLEITTGSLVATVLSQTLARFSRASV